MSILQPDLLWGTALRVAIADMRKNQYLLEDAYSDLIQDKYLKDFYGEKEVERFKAFIMKEIQVFIEHRPPDHIKLPYVCVKVGGAEEDTQKDALGDSYNQQTVDPATLGGAAVASPIIAGPTTPISYDSLTGTITFGNDVNLTTSGVYDTQFVYDTVNNKSYPIQLVLDDSNLLIEPGSTPNLTGMLIKRTQDSIGQVRRSIWFYRTDSIELASSDGNEVMYLFTLIMYILLRYKKHLWDARNFAVSTISHSELYRISPNEDPNNVYGITIKVRGRTEQSVIESSKPILGGFNTELKIADMTSPESVQESQPFPLWDGEGDPQ